jgi:uncharacterized protein (DUF433 family)/DNA-binding transcriptional MerR regulator
MMGYSAPIAAALSGTSVRQLAYWRSAGHGGPLLRPEFARDSRVLYSFRDVVALRTVAYLREEVSLQRIRRAVETLRDLGSREHLSRYRLVADAGSVVWVTDLGSGATPGGVDLVLRPGQEVLVGLRDVLSAFTNAAGLEVPDFTHPRPKLHVDADVLAGYPVVAGTRVPFDLVAGLVAGGVPVARVGDYYPGVGAEAAAQAADYAAYVERVASRHPA